MIDRARLATLPHLKAEEVDLWLARLIDLATCPDCADVPGRICCKWTDQEYREEVVRVYRLGLSKRRVA